VRRPGIALIAAAAWVGVVVGHLVSYFATYPSQGLRHIHLAVTGHSWLGLATASLLGAIPVLILVVAIRSVRSQSRGSGLALRLAAIQVPAFVLIELMEREWSVVRALSDPAVFLGLALMPLLAIVTAWVLDLLHRAVRAIVVRFDRTAQPVTRSFPRPVLDEPSQRFWLLLPSRRRAPPLPVSA
jgi:hypothetical protein